METTYGEMLKFHCPRWDELPDIALYMDQVLTVLEKHLCTFSGDEGDSVTTSTMINNYVKQNVVLSPVKKKYQKEQLAQLLVIGIAKRVLSISEIDGLIRLLSKKYTLKDAYNLFCATFENALKVTFGEKYFEERYVSGDTSDTALTALNAACFAVANKILVTKILYDNRKTEENEKPQKKKSSSDKEKNDKPEGED